jgi:hypothetical protein
VPEVPGYRSGEMIHRRSSTLEQRSLERQVSYFLLALQRYDKAAGWQVLDVKDIRKPSTLHEIQTAFLKNSTESKEGLVIIQETIKPLQRRHDLARA